MTNDKVEILRQIEVLNRLRNELDDSVLESNSKPNGFKRLGRLISKMIDSKKRKWA